MSANIFSLIIDQVLSTKTDNFPDSIYNIGPQNHITILLNTLLGDAGTGQLNKVQTTALNTQDLNGIEFSDLDNIPGFLIGAPRLPNEQYNFLNNPFTQQLTKNNLDLIATADSHYRERLSLMLTAINNGATILGLTLLAEAMLGTQVRITEVWKSMYSGGNYVYTSPSSSPSLNTNSNTKISSMFNTNSISEFLIIPKGETNFDQNLISSLMQTMEFLKPSNSIATFYPASYTYNNVSYNNTSNIVSFLNGYTARPSDLYSQVTGINIPDNTYITQISNFSSGSVASITLSNTPSGPGNILTIVPTNFETPLNNKQIIADSEWFEFDKIVSSSNNTNTFLNQLSSFSDRYWLNNNGSATAPLFAHTSTIEEEIPLNSSVSNISLVTYPSPGSINPPIPPTPTTTEPTAGPGQIFAPANLPESWKMYSPGQRYYVSYRSDGNLVVVDTYTNPGPPILVPNQELYYNGSQSNLSSYGSSGSNVVFWQNWMNFFGIVNTIDYMPLTLDGLFGARTKNATIQFQTQNNCVPDGIVGPQTWGALQAILNYFNALNSQPQIIWQTGTGNGYGGPGTLSLQNDGNLVIYEPYGSVEWAAYCFGKNVMMQMQDDGNLVIYETSGSPNWAIYAPNTGGKAIWSSKTGIISQDINGFNSFVKQNTPAPITKEINYGNWISVGLADSPDNFPNGQYPGNPGNYTNSILFFAGPDSPLSQLNVLSLNDTLSSPLPGYGNPGKGSFVTNNGQTHTFNYSGIQNTTIGKTTTTGTLTSGNIVFTFYLDNITNSIGTTANIAYNATNAQITSAIKNILTDSFLTTNNMTLTVTGTFSTNNLVIQIFTTNNKGTQHIINLTMVTTNLVGGGTLTLDTSLSTYCLTNIIFDGQLSDVISNNTSVNVDGGYNFEYPNQSTYVAYITQMVNKLGGIFNADNTAYQLPISNSQFPSQNISLNNIMAPLPTTINASVYGG